MPVLEKRGTGTVTVAITFSAKDIDYATRTLQNLITLAAREHTADLFKRGYVDMPSVVSSSEANQEEFDFS